MHYDGGKTNNGTKEEQREQILKRAQEGYSATIRKIGFRGTTGVGHRVEQGMSKDGGKGKNEPE